MAALEVVAKTRLDAKTVQRSLRGNAHRKPAVDAFRKKFQLIRGLIGNPKLGLIAEGIASTNKLVINAITGGTHTDTKARVTDTTSEIGPYFVLCRYLIITIQKKTIGLNGAGRREILRRAKELQRCILCSRTAIHIAQISPEITKVLAGCHLKGGTQMERGINAVITEGLGLKCTTPNRHIRTTP